MGYKCPCLEADGLKMNEVINNNDALTACSSCHPQSLRTSFVISFILPTPTHDIKKGYTFLLCSITWFLVSLYLFVYFQTIIILPDTTGQPSLLFTCIYKCSAGCTPNRTKPYVPQICKIADREGREGNLEIFVIEIQAKFRSKSECHIAFKM